MKKNIGFLPKICMMMLLLGNVVGAHAVNITYSLTTHPVFNYSYTITSSISVNAGSDLLDNMPQDLWRAYTTYKFYSDADLTNEITVAPSESATVFVDYVFNPAFIPSIEGEDPNWLFLRGYNESAETSTGNSYLLYKRHSQNQINGYHYTSSGGLPKAGNNYPMEKATHCYWAIYGDGFNCQIKLNDDEHDYWLIWRGTSGNVNIGLASRASYNGKGWQLYTNTAKNKRISGGTMAMGVPDVSNYLYELTDVNSTCRTSSLTTSKHHFNSKNELVGEIAGTTNYKPGLWWYALFATPTMTTTPVLYHVTYKILKAYDYNAQRIEYSVQKTTNQYTYNQYYKQEKELSGCTYTFYKDAALTIPYTEGETLPTTENTIVYVKESCPQSDHWVTMVSPFTINDVTKYFGSKDDGETPAASVLEYTSVSTTDKGNNTVSVNLSFTETTTMEAHKPYLVKFDEVGSVWLAQQLADNEAANASENDLVAVTCTDSNVPNVDVSMKGTYDGFTLRPQSSDTDPAYFYFGYNAKYDPDSDSYDEAAAEGKTPYNFYVVKKNNATIPAYRCYFYAKGTSGSVNLSMMGITDGIGEVLEDIVMPTPVQGIYNLKGQMVRGGHSVEGLPAGIYVVNGKKLVVK